MKLCCISDLHGELADLDFGNADIVIIAGDFSKMYGFGKWHLYDQKKWIQKKFIPFTQDFKEKQFIVVPGNHDLCLDPCKTNCYHDLNWNITWPENVHLLLDSWIEINGIKIYGTPYIPIINYRWAFECEHDILLQEFNKIPTNLDILVTHSPPRISGSDIDYSLQTQDGPFGSSELTQAIFMKQPRYVFCGHIHSGDHECVEFEGAKIFNVSRLNEDYCIAYKPLFLDI